jgi:hypothetical protein
MTAASALNPAKPRERTNQEDCHSNQRGRRILRNGAAGLHHRPAGHRFVSGFMSIAYQSVIPAGLEPDPVTDAITGRGRLFLKVNKSK